MAGTRRTSRKVGSGGGGGGGGGGGSMNISKLVWAILPIDPYKWQT